MATPVLENLPYLFYVDHSESRQQHNVEQVAAPNDDDAGNKAMKMDFFSYENNIGEIDMLITPVIDLSSAPFALFKFDVALCLIRCSEYGRVESYRADNCNPDINRAP